MHIKSVLYRLTRSDKMQKEKKGQEKLTLLEAKLASQVWRVSEERYRSASRKSGSCAQEP
jgi:hypothetical protein